MNSAETAAATVATPIRTYYHPNYSGEVSLVGMIHLAQPDYYGNIQQIVDAKHAQGAAVHYESVRDCGPEEMQLAPSSLVNKAQRIRDTLHALYDYFGDSGLANEVDVLVCRDTWENHDASELDLASRISSFTLRRQQVAAKLLGLSLRHMDGEAKQKLIRDVISKSLERSVDEDDSKGWFRRLLVGDMDSVVLHYRNSIALEALDRQRAAAPETDVVLLWGAGHLRGLGNGLTARGFVKAREEKIIAIG